MLLRYYRVLNERLQNLDPLLRAVRTFCQNNRMSSDRAMELCFYIDVDGSLTSAQAASIEFMLAETYEPENLGMKSFIQGVGTIAEVGPNLNVETAWSSRAVSIFHAMGLTQVRRVEFSRRIAFGTSNKGMIEVAIKTAMDEMLYACYPEELLSFEKPTTPSPVQTIDVLGRGIAALQEANRELGLAMDTVDLNLFYTIFVEYEKRNPTDVELFHFAQANSEHSRHHFFRGKLIIDGVLMPQSLMEIVKAPYLAHPGNSIAAFDDDSSAIRGGSVHSLAVPHRGTQYVYRVVQRVLHPTFTAETHNHPTYVKPFEGAQTGVGGMVRDLFAIRRGGTARATISGYAVEELMLDVSAHEDTFFQRVWEQTPWLPALNYAVATEVLMGGSDGVADYGNCLGLPTIGGFARSFALDLPGGRRAFTKPILYAAGVGHVADEHIDIQKPAEGMVLVQIGGPAYRIGVGGGAASSMNAGDNKEVLDFNSVQRGDPELENRLLRVIRACVELGGANPFVAVKDLGAGGDSNALPELVEEAGARINLRAIPLGDSTLSVLEYWGNESQERCAFVIRKEHLKLLQEICTREDISCALVGEVTGDKRIVVFDERDGSTPVDLSLDQILGNLPRKEIVLTREPKWLLPLVVNPNLSVKDALAKVLRLLSVGSKRFLTSKKDRSVTGLVAQQQCVGPNHLPIADYALVADGYFGTSGTAMSVGEQPIKGLLSPAAMARLAVAEALFNIVGVRISDLKDIRFSANWMWPAKSKGEGANLYDAACALRDICLVLGIAPDGGKDSLSMESVKMDPYGITRKVAAPGQLVIGAYAYVHDITRKVTPDFKKEHGNIFHIPLNPGRYRMGGSSFAHVHGQIGNEPPDVDDPGSLARIFEAVQSLILHDRISALHDISDGGLIVTLLEMAFASNFGLDVRIPAPEGILGALFAEEPGLILETSHRRETEKLLDLRGIFYEVLGYVTSQPQIRVAQVTAEGTKLALDEPMVTLRSMWEETSFDLEDSHTDADTPSQERTAVRDLIISPPYQLTFTPHISLHRAKNAPKASVVRERGSNGDRELAAVLMKVGFEVVDVTMTDLVNGSITLEGHRLITFPGGFTFGDVLDSAKGWAAVARFNPNAAAQLGRFFAREDTISLGICNGCQFAALLGKYPFSELDFSEQPRFVRNLSGRFESRFPTLEVQASNSVFLQGMEGSRLGIWSAHGEGYLHASDDVLARVVNDGLAPLRYVDETGAVTTRYPFNPNGSPHGIAGLKSSDGRHLMMMPHPERTIEMWNLPWYPKSWEKFSVSPWIKMFQNAYDWCIVNPTN